MRNSLAAVVCVACLAVAPWGTSASPARAPASYMYILMVDMIGPAANSLWASAAAPALSDQEWERAKQLAARLSETAASVASGGTTPADAERAKSSEWKIWADKFRDTVSLTAKAAERRDRPALAAAADALVEVCQGCHTAFPQAAQ